MMNEPKPLGVGDPCLRDADGRVYAWCVGMSGEDISGFLREHPWLFLSTGIETREGVR